MAVVTVVVVVVFLIPMEAAAGSSPKARIRFPMPTRLPQAIHRRGVRVWRCHTLGEG